ncbi:MAG: ankyrin repeat domain-containing protein [Bryobacteraceae bacterium]
MQQGSRHRYSLAHGLAFAMLAAMAGTWANAQSKSNDLIFAAAQGDLPAVNALLNAGTDVNDARETNIGSSTALMEASSNGHLEIVRALLAAGAQVNAIRGSKAKGERVCDTALALASRNSHLPVVQALLAAKADVDAGLVSALYCATAAGNLDIIKLLLATKPKLDWQDPLGGSTALMLALAPNEAVLRIQLPSAGRWDIAQLLIDAGANVNVTDKGGVTALKLVVQENSPRNLAMVRSLLAAHADVNGGCVCKTTALLPLGSGLHMSASGQTALGLASALGSVEVVQALLDANAQRAAHPSVAVDAKQSGGNTPLTLAAAKGRADIVRLLLAAKADASVANNDGKTALLLALENNQQEVAELLRNAVTGQK